MQCVFFHGKNAGPERSESLASQNKEEERRGGQRGRAALFSAASGSRDHFWATSEQRFLRSAAYVDAAREKKKKKCVQINSELCCIFMLGAK